MATIAVIGAGAVGSYYGALLARAGHDVRFLMRRDLPAVTANGLRVHSPLGGFHLPAVSAFASAGEIGVVDWVVCALKATSLGETRALAGPCLGPGTRLVALMNGYGIEESFSAWAGAGRVFGAMAFVCINRGEPGEVHHLDYGRLSIAHAEDNPAENECLRALLTSAGIDTVIAPNLRYARWEKLCWNIPFNGLSVAAGGVSTKTILGDALLRETAERAMREVVVAANRDLEAAGSGARLDPDEVTSRLFALTETMGDYRTSMVLDYLAGRELEVEAILGAPLRRAAELNAPTPIVGVLYALASAAGRARRDELALLEPRGGGPRDAHAAAGLLRLRRFRNVHAMARAVQLLLTPLWRLARRRSASRLV